MDRSGQIYISSVLAYLADPTVGQFNFFKVNPHVITAQITEYVRNCLASREEEQLVALEQTFAEELFWRTREEDDDIVQTKKPKAKKEVKEAPPADILLNERINAKLFQFKLKRHGIALSMWEVFTLFEYLNTVVAKQVFYEPQRYHGCLWEHFYQLITGKTDYREVLDQRGKPVKKKKAKHSKEEEDALSLAESLNQSSDSEVSGEEPEEVDMSKLRKRNANKPYAQVKHIFDVNLTSLHQIPLLSKYCNQANDFEIASQELPQTSAYI